MINFTEINRAVSKKYNKDGKIVKHNESGEYFYSPEITEKTSININQIISFGEELIPTFEGEKMGTYIDMKDGSCFKTFESYYLIKAKIIAILRNEKKKT